MRGKKWLLTVVCALLLVGAVCVLSNWLIDPFGVFEASPLQWDSYAQTLNPRGSKVRYISERPGEYDSFVVGSSSAASYLPETLERYYGGSFYNMFHYGADTDYDRELVRYLLEQGEVKRIVLVLGLSDAYALHSKTEGLTAVPDYRVSGENEAAYKLRFLFASPSFAMEKLYITQPSLTATVKELERELGIIIFHRSGRGVSLTADGQEFLTYAGQLYHQYEALAEKYGPSGTLKKKFGVSTQHYSFAVKAFVETVKNFDTAKYEFAIRETKTKEVIEDVKTLRSEIGIIYLSDFNRNFINKILKTGELEFHRLIDCGVFVYLWKNHPLANKSCITAAELNDYPCLSFEQGADSSLYLAEEIFVGNEFPQTIKANDRATMLNLMVGLNGFTLCSGIICEELNGDEYRAVPFSNTEENNQSMEIGYITRKNQLLGKIGNIYIKNIRQYLML